MLVARFCCVLLLGTAACLPLHTTSSNATLALVLCRGLDAAVRELREYGYVVADMRGIYSVKDLKDQA